jgi:hypothetical protein
VATIGLAFHAVAPTEVDCLFVNRAGSNRLAPRFVAVMARWRGESSRSERLRHRHLREISPHFCVEIIMSSSGLAQTGPDFENSVQIAIAIPSAFRINMRRSGNSDGATTQVFVEDSEGN